MVNKKQLYKSCTFEDYLAAKDYTDLMFDWHTKNKGTEIK